MQKVHDMKLTKIPGRHYGEQTVVDLRPNQLALLWSPWGVEGVFKDEVKMLALYMERKGMAAYRNEPFFFQIFEEDSGNEITRA